MDITERYRKPSDLPKVIPIFPLSEALLLPRGELPLRIFEPRYLAMIDAALASDRVIGMIQPTNDSEDEIGLLEVGTAGRITSFTETHDGRYIITLTGISRFTIEEEIDLDTPYRNCRIDAKEFMGDFQVGDGEDDVDRQAVLSTLSEYVRSRDLEVDWSSINDASNEALVNGLSMLCPYGPEAKQALLEASNLATRAELLVALTECDICTSGSSGASLQ